MGLEKRPGGFRQLPAVKRGRKSDAECARLGALDGFGENPPKSLGMNGGDDGTRSRDFRVTTWARCIVRRRPN